MIRKTLVTLLTVLTALGLWAGRPSVIAVAQTQDNRGLIDGIVTYEDRKPVMGATVYATPIGRPIGAIIPHAETDETGYFVIHIYPSWFGRFAVTAKKEDENFPDMNQFYSDGKFATVTLTPRHRAETVIIRLGPKAGVLVGTVADAVTGAPLNPCVELRRAKEPNNFLAGTGLVNANYHVLVPSNTDVLMKIWYRGHKPWFYPGTTDKAQSRPINLKPGEEAKLDIRLEPDSKSPPEGCGMPVGTVIQP
jgi:hypothetical protein